MRRASDGFSFVETLAAVALVGLLAMTGVGLVTSLTQVAVKDSLSDTAWDGHLMALRHLRADAGRSDMAIVSGGRLLVRPGGTAAWCVRNGSLFEVPDEGGETCDPSAIRVRRLGHASVIEMDLAQYGRVIVLVGGGEP